MIAVRNSTAPTHVLRLTVRVHVGAFHREVDLSVPAGSTLADVAPEILDLCAAPQITRPWRATTAAGLPIEQSVALQHSPLDHGSILVLTPAEPVDAPIVRDSAEALVAELGDGHGAFGAAQLATVTGVLALTAIAALFLPLAGAFATGAGAAGAIVIWRRDAHLVALAAVIAAGAAAAAYVDPTFWTGSGWAAVAGAGAAGLTALLGAALRAVGTRALAAVLTAALLLLLGAAGDLLDWLPSAAAPAAAVLLGCLALVSFGPGVAAKAAGLHVPALPTAGQDLTISDAAQPDVQHRARRAGRLTDGMAVGAALIAVPAALLTGWHGGLWPQLLCVTVAGAVLMHAARHRSPAPGWSLAVIGLSACAGTALAAVRGEQHPATVALAAAVALAALTAVLWAPRVRELEPTTMAWWERAEFLAVLACLPLAVHVTGLFSVIRGLG